MKRILILGTGSLGSEIAFTFSKRHKITCIDHGRNFSILKKQLSNVKLVKGDIKNVKLVQKESKDSDIVFFCIDTGGVLGCMRYPKKYFDINVSNFKNIINLFQRTNLHFFLFSSIFVYPDLPNATEKTELKPETKYGTLRMMQEQILKNQNINFTILRLSNIFGYGHFFNVGNMGAIEKFIDVVFTGKKIFLDGDGNQKVDYIYKDELMLLLQKLMNCLDSQRVYNVSTGVVRPVSKIAEIIQQIASKKFNKHVDIVRLDKNSKLPNLPRASSIKVMKELSWKPSSNIKSRINTMMKIYNLQHKG